MAPQKVVQIMVAGRRTGIVGLKEALYRVGEIGDGWPDEKIKARLLKMLSKTNWISDQVQDEYGIAFLREYKRFVGLPFNETAGAGILEIKVLGLGCPRCERLTQDLMCLLAELDIKADLEHIRDPVEITRYEIMGSPALVINGSVKAVGSIPAKSVLATWLLEASGK